MMRYDPQAAKAQANQGVDSLITQLRLLETVIAVLVHGPRYIQTATEKVEEELMSDESDLELRAAEQHLESVRELHRLARLYAFAGIDNRAVVDLSEQLRAGLVTE